MIRLALCSTRDHEALTRDEAPPELLSPRELEALSKLTFPARRLKWLLGRVAAKRLVCEAVEQQRGRPLAPARLTIANEPSGAPYAEIEGEGRLPYSLSISHRADLGLAALAIDPKLALGADLELVEPRDDALVRQFFVEREADEVAQATGRARDALVARIWSAKEAVLKALGVGLRLDTRSIEVRAAPKRAAGPPFPEGFEPLDVVVHGHAEPLRVVFRDEGRYVITLALMVATRTR